MELSPRLAGIEERKARAIESLSVQFSRNVLPMDEYERLVEYIHRAESERELAIIEKIVDETALYAGVRQEGAPREAGDSSPDMIKPALTLLSTRIIPGEILRRDNGAMITILGESIIDIQEGDLPPGRTVVNQITLLGTTEIRVPPNLAVSVSALPILGNITVARGVETRRYPGEPELIITGPVLLGEIHVRLRKDETSRHNGRRSRSE
jgi:hypothetical protein